MATRSRRLCFGNQVTEAESAHRSRLMIDRARGHVDGDGGAGRRDRSTSLLSVDEQLEHTIRARWQTDEVTLRGPHIQLDQRRGGSEGKSHTRGLRFGHRQLRVGVLPAGACRQAMHEHTIRRVLEVGRATH
ncbi:hypothetical protein [Williamsia sp. 1135]|uniref:hypothetical protein n=1 Tax=Williamsia sp. 1135 TaxID=1889262 RepID=UPI00320470EE